MGMPDADHGIAQRAGLSEGEAKRPVAADVYLTDDVFLYRVLDLVAGPGGGMVELEDCYWLDVVRVPVARLRARRLRVVTAAD